MLYKVGQDQRLVKDVREFLRPPVVIYVNEFNEKAAKQFLGEVSLALSSGQTFLPIIIDSYGGSCDSLAAMLDAVESVKKLGMAVLTYVSGKAMSCGAILAAMGTPGMRFMGPDSTVMIHDVTLRTGGNETDLSVAANLVKKTNTKLFQKIAINGGQDKDYYLNLLKKNDKADLFLDSKEAKKHKLIDVIGVPHICINVQVTETFTVL